MIRLLFLLRFWDAHRFGASCGVIGGKETRGNITFVPAVLVRRVLD